MFVNTLVLRADLSGDPTFAELLGRVRAMALQAYAHQDLPFEQLVDALVTDRDRSRTPLFQVMFNYRTAGRGDADRAGQRPDAEAPGSGGARAVKFDLSLIVIESGPVLAGLVEYSTALFDAATAGRLAGHLGVLLAAVAADTQARLSELPVLTAGEREELLVGWNDTAAAGACGGRGARADRRAGGGVPGRGSGGGRGHVRIVCGPDGAGGPKLAGFLLGAGVGAETVVGLCLDRGVDMVTAVLAVWQAGGAYLPLDPDYPAERLAFMLADSRASVVVGTTAATGESAGRAGAGDHSR